MVRRVLLLALLGFATCPAAPAAAVVHAVCIGDCDQNSRIDITDLIVAVKVVLGESPVTACPSINCDTIDVLPISCLLIAVDGAMRGDCASPPPGSPLCGDVVCDVSEYCCNPLLSICTPPGEGCIQ